MTMQWIKFDNSTPAKVEVRKMARQLGLHPHRVIGSLVLIWCWFDDQTLTGWVDDEGADMIDDLADCPGFAMAMVGVGWLKINPTGIELPRFHRHNGKTAKARAMKNRRQAQWRAKPLQKAKP